MKASTYLLKAASGYFRELEGFVPGVTVSLPQEILNSKILSTLVLWSESLISKEGSRRLDDIQIDFDSWFVDDVHGLFSAATYLDFDRRFTSDLFGLCLQKCTMDRTLEMLTLCQRLQEDCSQDSLVNNFMNSVCKVACQIFYKDHEDRAWQEMEEALINKHPHILKNILTHADYERMTIHT